MLRISITFETTSQWGLRPILDWSHSRSFLRGLRSWLLFSSLSLVPSHSSLGDGLYLLPVWFYLGIKDDVMFPRSFTACQGWCTFLADPIYSGDPSPGRARDPSRDPSRAHWDPRTRCRPCSRGNTPGLHLLETRDPGSLGDDTCKFPLHCYNVASNNFLVNMQIPMFPNPRLSCHKILVCTRFSICDMFAT
jgi:hypothetical protein